MNAQTPEIPADVKTRLAEMANACAALKSLAATVTLQSQRGSERMEAQTQLLFRRPDRVRIACRTGGRDGATEVLTLFDGVFLCQIRSRDPRHYRRERLSAGSEGVRTALLQAEAFATPLLPWLLTDTGPLERRVARLLPEAPDTVRWEGVETAEGGPADRLAVGYRAADGSPRTLTLVIGSRDRLPRRVALRLVQREGGVREIVEAYTRLQPGIDLPDSRFVFVPQPGAQPLPTATSRKKVRP